MEIKKLTISPLISGFQNYVYSRPSNESAGVLIKERLVSGESFYNSDRPARALRKIPKWLKGFVNPKALVVKERKFDINS